MGISNLKRQLRELSDPAKADGLKRFFKTGPGQYGAGDRFLGVVAPDLRKLAKAYLDIPPDMVPNLLRSQIHEDRMAALMIWTYQFDRADETDRAKIFSLYSGHTQWINNWDLVDNSAPSIVGRYLFDKEKAYLYTLAESVVLWERRIAMVATQYFIRQDHFEDTLAIARILVDDDQDLIHKAVGWMLREVGKRNQILMEKFLLAHYDHLPRTTLRYAIEKLPENRRRDYLKGSVS